jgi:hypothetical protein
MPLGGTGGAAMMMMGGQPGVDGGPDAPVMGGMGGVAVMGGIDGLIARLEARNKSNARAS